MTRTPFDSAFFSIAAPDEGSSGSIRSTDAPSVMSASACCCIVDGLPCALSILKSLDDRPAASNACFRYGASYWTYRVDVVVSGSRTPILPLPCAARSLSSAICEKSAVSVVTSNCGTFPEELPPPPLLDDPLDPPQAAATAASATTTMANPRG